MTALSTEAANFGWLLDNFVRTVPGTRHTLVVSADGLLMAMSEQLDRTSGDQLAAIVSGMSSLTRGASRQLRAGEVRVRTEGEGVLSWHVDGGFLSVDSDTVTIVVDALSDSTSSSH